MESLRSEEARDRWRGREVKRVETGGEVER